MLGLSADFVNSIPAHTWEVVMDHHQLAASLPDAIISDPGTTRITTRVGTR
jgi:hypothetical protein